LISHSQGENGGNVQQSILSEHLGIVLEGCKNLFPDLRSVILCGGYGRDEGSWFRDSSGAWRPYNDYDICVVVSKKKNDSEVKALELFLAKKVGIRWIDIDQYTVDGLRNLRPSIKSYDLKYASRVIAGDDKILECIPEIDGSKLSLKEVEVLYFTRLYTLIGSLKLGGFNQNLDGIEAMFFRNQMAKALLAIVDVLLLTKGAYDASYCVRVRRLSELYPEKSDLIGLCNWALKEKLEPTMKFMSLEEALGLYKTVHSHFFFEMFPALSLWFKKKVETPRDVEFCVKWLPYNLLKRIYWILWFRGVCMEKIISLKLAQNFIAAAWRDRRIDQRLLDRGITLLRSAGSRLPENASWDQARLEAACLRAGGGV